MPEDLINKIAAGEVVERPASVVKELVENALDARAAKISVFIEGGGRRLIRVRDDGAGMSGEDAALACERHATSKLAQLEDLHAIGTHGFRGEALSSIASVGHLILRTRTEDDPGGTEVEVRHGQLLHVRDVGHPRGTTVELRDLFGAIPARRKFLRSDSTEAGHLAEAVTLLALARPAVGFSLASGKRNVIEAPPVEDLGARLYQIFGPGVLDSLCAVEGEPAWLRVHGFVSKPGAARGARPSLRLFVNGRPVRDRALAKAVSEAYRASGGAERAFEAFVFVEMPLDMVDVNVHPAKTEVRFADPRTVWTAVEHAVEKALSGAARGTRPAAPRGGADLAREAVERYLARGETTRTTSGTSPWSSDVDQRADGSVRQPEREGRPADVGAGSAEPAGAAGTLFVAGPPTVLGQHRKTYIVASDGEDLLLIDQHTAHERVRFERLKERLAARGEAESQRLLTPSVVTLAPSLLSALEEHAEALSALGFEAELFGGASVKVRAVPAVLGTRDPGPALGEFLQDFLDRGTAEWIVNGERDRLAATLACHSAVRAGETLQMQAMVAIVHDLGRTRHPGQCPHGRPTLARLPREDVSRRFGRLGWKRS